ncbi:MAG: hypothetical protein LBQ86_05155, partial [Holophagales bacterium]|nr:hypothetical protein [Holophagales bacterium]
KRLAVFKIRLRLERLRRRIRSFPFLSPPVGGSLHSQRSLRAPRGSTFSKLNDYNSMYVFSDFIQRFS